MTLLYRQVVEEVISTDDDLIMIQGLQSGRFRPNCCTNGCGFAVDFQLVAQHVVQQIDDKSKQVECGPYRADEWKDLLSDETTIKAKQEDT